MSDNDYSGFGQATRREVMQQTALYAAIGAAFMLFFGFGRPYDVASGSSLYVSSVFATNWVLRIGGLALLGAALLCWIGVEFGLLVDAAVSAIIGASLLVIGGIWISDGDNEGFLFILFAALFLSAARHSWRAYGSIRAAPVAGFPTISNEPAASSDSDERRQHARDRLLQAKANLRREPTAAVTPAVSDPVSPAMHEIVEPPTPKEPPPQLSDEVAPAAPAPSRVEPSPRAADEDVDGFLAELGRQDASERK